MPTPPCPRKQLQVVTKLRYIYGTRNRCLGNYIKKTIVLISRRLVGWSQITHKTKLKRTFACKQYDIYTLKTLFKSSRCCVLVCHGGQVRRCFVQNLFIILIFKFVVNLMVFWLTNNPIFLNLYNSIYIITLRPQYRSIF